MATQIHNREHAGFPLRVICLKETFESGGGICFDVPGNWDFHIISHTWTADARNWSLKIANIMAERKRTEKDAYAELFKQKSFAGEGSYTELLEFLRMLAVDGVQRVWFDALCINQKDEEEKNREIAQMSQYYARSAGCYVWCHGMGGGFRLWAEEAERPRYCTLPRWFSRVWTLQEFVLPSKLAFIVGMDKEGCTAMFAYKAYCRFSGLGWQPAELIDNQIETKFVRRFESSRQVNSRELFPCPHCSHQQKGHVYFVEREKYFELMNQSSHKSIEVDRLPSNFRTEFKSPLHRLLTILSCSDQLSRLQRAALAVREISVRDCSEFHDEDRLLSILGLLQIEGKVQLRTGRGLHEQIYDVAQSLLNSSPTAEHHRLLLLLCVAQYRGSPISSMSWAPTFTLQNVLGDIKLQSLSVFHNGFTSIAQVERLDKSGLVLRCPFLRAKAVPFSEHWQKCSTCLQCRHAARIAHMNHFILEVENRQHYSVLLWATDEDHDGELRFLSVSPSTFTMSIKSDTNVKTLRTMSFHVYLLLLVQDQLPGSSEPYGMFLVCIGKDIANLHKVGVFICGPGWDPEAMEEPGAYDTPDTRSEDSTSEEGGCFNNEELEDFQDSQVTPWKDEFPAVAPDDEELDSDEEEEEEGEEEEDEHERDDEVDVNWEQDVHCMESARFIVGGFGAIVPLSVLTSDKIIE